MPIARDPYLQVYRADAADPDIAVGWDEQVEDKITAPAYDGLLGLSYATPAPLERSLELTRRRPRRRAAPGRCRRRTPSVDCSSAPRWAWSASWATSVGPEDTTIVTEVALVLGSSRRPGSAG